jgi:hypothetical protein
MTAFINVKAFGRWNWNEVITYDTAYNSGFRELFNYYIDIACEIKHIYHLASHLRDKCRRNTRLFKKDDNIIFYILEQTSQGQIYGKRPTFQNRLFHNHMKPQRKDISYVVYTANNDDIQKKFKHFSTNFDGEDCIYHEVDEIYTLFNEVWGDNPDILKLTIDETLIELNSSFENLANRLNDVIKNKKELKSYLNAIDKMKMKMRMFIEVYNNKTKQ